MRPRRPTLRRTTTSVCAEFIYPVNGVAVRPDLLGGSSRTEQDEFQIEVCFPLTKSDPPRLVPPGITELTASFEAQEGRADADRILLRVSWEVETASELTVQDELHKGSQVASKVIESLLALIRSEGNQAWLGLSGEARRLVLRLGVALHQERGSLAGRVHRDPARFARGRPAIRLALLNRAAQARRWSYESGGEP